MESAPIIDKSKLSKTISTVGIVFPANLSNEYLKKYKPFLLNQEKLPNLAKDFAKDNNKLLLLNPSYKLSDMANWPQELQELITKNNYETMDYTIKLGYDDMSAHEVLQQLLPNDVMIPGGFETVGTIAHLNLHKNQLPYKEIIGQVLLDKNKTIKTVVNKTDKLNNVFRTPELEIIAGEKTLDTELKEAGVTFKLNFEKVYWNSKLQAERDRLLKLFKPNEILCDMFCGIGPLSIRAAKMGMKVYANDLNPECFEYLKINSKLNKVEHLVKPYNMDAREFVRHLINKEDAFFNHVYMNLPVDALEFLDVFDGLMKEKKNKRWNKHNLPFIHVSAFDTGKTIEEVENNFEERIQKVLKNFKKGSISYIHQIKNITAEKKMFCVGFKLPEEVAFGGIIEDDKEETAEDFEKIEKKVKSE